MSIENLEPKIVWNNLKKICDIPHPSGHLDAIRLFIIDKAHALDLEVETDGIGNIRVSLPPSEGCESAAGLILEAHMDMVPQAEEGHNHNFLCDPISPRIVDGKWVMAKRTSLGADNGVGMAALLSVMEDKTLRHGPIECLFTVDEETGMTGANQLQENWLKGEYMINTDTESEGKIMIGCAGAVNMTARFNYRMDYNIPEGDVAIKISLKGLKGGHSGMDIHLGRGNACKLLFRFLKHAVINYEARLASVKAGSLRNAIPREAYAVITVPEELVDDMMEEIKYYNELYSYEYRNIEDALSLTAEVTALPTTLLPEEIQDDVINCVEACHDGLWRMSPEDNGVVETSSNLALIETNNEETVVLFLIRSLSEEGKRVLASQLQSVFLLGGARVEFDSAYPGWELSKSSPLLRIAKTVYHQTFNTYPSVNKVHCGLECGIFSTHYKNIDIISIGPSIHHPHSPLEYVEINSVDKFWKYLCALIREISLSK